MLKNVVAIDLFCGIGGLTYGLQQAGIKVLAGVDIDSSCKYAYEKNNNAIFINKSVEDLRSEELIKLYKNYKIKILVGCAPCQPFSNYSLRYQKNGKKDEKWKLLYQFANLIEKVNPDIISMENVPQLEKEKVFQDFLLILQKNKYYVSWKIINCAEYGVPQNRKRLVLLASKFGNIEIHTPIYSPENYKTVIETIGFLPKIKDGESCKLDPLHKASKLSTINKLRIKNSIPGGSWKSWDPSLILKCHLKSSGKTYGSVYGRMEWNKPSPTITTQFYGYGNGRFGHPEQDRAISLREGALLQSFPRNYIFINPEKPQSNRELGTHIGNAVPVKLGEYIGISIIEHLKIWSGIKYE